MHTSFGRFLKNEDWMVEPDPHFGHKPEDHVGRPGMAASIDGPRHVRLREKRGAVF